jgi:hypothetical protein
MNAIWIQTTLGVPRCVENELVDFYMILDMTAKPGVNSFIS